MISLLEIIESCKAEALASKLSPNEVSNWRYFCREYSKTFHTPLHEVLEMAPEQVLLAVFEDQLSRRSVEDPEGLESITEDVRRIQDPDYDSNAAKEFDEFVELAEAQEAERLRTGAPIPKPKSKKKQEQPKLDAKQELPPDLPKSGYVDMSKFRIDEES